MPESTAWKPLSKTEKASSTERLVTDSITSSLLVNKCASLRLKTKQIKEKKNPMTVVVAIATFTENFAALASPLPSSFETRTLENQIRYKRWYEYNKRWRHPWFGEIVTGIHLFQNNDHSEHLFWIIFRSLFNNFMHRKDNFIYQKRVCVTISINKRIFVTIYHTKRCYYSFFFLCYYFKGDDHFWRHTQRQLGSQRPT